MTYIPGQSVKRLEDRPQVRATVLTVEDGPDGQLLELAYEEGGYGWWPASRVGPNELA
jgi:hypothetical protein